MGILRKYGQIKAGVNYRDKTEVLKIKLLKSLNDKQAIMLDEIDKRITDKNETIYSLILLIVAIGSFIFGFILCDAVHKIAEILTTLFLNV